MNQPSTSRVPGQPGSREGDAWAEHAESLADFALARIVMRTDVFGGYCPKGTYTAHEPLTRDVLVGHFRGERVIGCHSTSPDNLCKWAGWDVDAHDDRADPESNLACAKAIRSGLRQFELVALILDSNGKGGFHVPAFFKSPVPAGAAFWLGEAVNAHLLAHGFQAVEHFPKQPELTLAHPYGNWMRLPGKHRCRDHWTRILDPATDRWLEGDEAIRSLIQVAGCQPTRLLAAYEARPGAAKAGTNGHPGPKTKGGARSQEDRPDEAKVRGALGHIRDVDGYDSWLAVGMCLNDWDAARGLDLWHEWSSRSPKYDAGVCDEKWKSFTPGGGLTVATLFKQAMRDGWEPPPNGARARGDAAGRPTTEDDGQDQAEPGPIGPNEAEDDPHRLARLYRDTRCTHDQMITTRYWRGEWQRWTGGAYHPVDGRELKAELTGSIKAEFDQLNRAALETHAERGSSLKAHAERGSDRDGPPTTRKVTTTLVNNVVQALTSYTLLDSRVGQPAWLDLDGPAPFPAAEVLPTRNALVHLTRLVKGEEAIRRPSPAFFAPYVVGYDFDLAAPEPINWLTFLGARPVTGESKVQLQLWPDDPQSIEMLQEWFGYHLTPDTSLQKIGTLIGPKRSGKGTIGRILAAMIGPENVAGPTLSGLTTNFGLAPLIGKPCAIISDARLSGRTDAAVVVERLLSISGEDALTVDRKHLPAWTGKLPTRFTLISNELPRVSDPSGALAGRLIILRLTRSFYGREMHELTDLLKEELPGILLWAIEGWRRLHERGYFRQPDSGRELVEQMENLASPHQEFVQDRCVLGPGREVMAARLYESWTRWCQEKGRDHAGTEQEFGRNLRAVLPTLTTHQRRQADGSRKWFYEGVGLEDGPSF